MKNGSKHRRSGVRRKRNDGVRPGIDGPIGFAGLIHSNRSRPLLELVRHAERLARIERTVSAYLPTEFRGHCVVANLRQATLILNAGSPVWAARLRFIAPALLNFLQSHCAEEGIDAVRVRVARALHGR